METCYILEDKVYVFEGHSKQESLEI